MKQLVRRVIQKNFEERRKMKMKLLIRGKIPLTLFLFLLVGIVYGVGGNLSVSAAETSRPELLTRSMSDKLSGVTPANIAVVPDPIGGGNHKEYAGTLIGFQEAMFDIYQYGDGGNYGVYVGTNVNVSTLTAEIPPATPSATSITFSSLKGKAANLVFTSTLADVITMNTTAVTAARTVTFGTNVHMGTGVVFRNISYTGTNMFMNGHDLHLAGNSYGNGLSIYGGADTADVTGSPTLTVDSTGSGTWNLYGGNQTGGTLTGNPTLRVNNTTGAINTLVGGSQIGTIDGNITTEVKNVAGTITNFYGAGEGTTVTNQANVTGNVTSSIISENSLTTMRIGSYFGGVNYGTVSGTISNTIKGYGGWTGTEREYYGGSAFGDIGSASTTNAIVNQLDTSQFSTGAIFYNGANSREGTIKGTILNTIRAGTYNRGSIRQINGAGGRNVTRLTEALNGSNNLTTYDAMTKAERKDLAEAGASFKVYGDIYTDVLGGSVSAGGDDVGYTKGFGWGGYLQGNTYVTMGTLREDGRTGGEGFAYDGDSISTATLTKAMNEGLDYAAANRSSFALTNGANFDIVGGGGSISGWSSDVFIQGNTNVVLNNTIARWTYGAGFSGVTQGNTKITMNGGFVDTLEGAGYYDRRIYGETKAIVNDGQVDWFLSGGGWTSLKVVGNANVDVHGGVINASMGASYGDNSAHTIDGDSHMYVYGGDFSGLPRTGNSGFSAGITQQGTLTGNANLTIDLRGYKGNFKFPSGTYISAGKPYNVNTYLGTDANNTMNLNIFADESSGDVLNGADIYGDGGAAGNTHSGQVNINIDAPGSTIGNLYTTQYSNISSNSLLRDVNVNVQRVKSVGGISGGNASDNFTNTIIRNSTDKKAVFNVGVKVGESESTVFQTDPINITARGLVNFTELNVDNGTTINAAGGNILNGGGATAANHGTTYNEFGTLNLKNGGGIGVSSQAGRISVGDVTVTGESKIESMPGTGIINLTSLKFTDDQSRFNWSKLVGGAATVLSNGTYWGNNQAFQVLTFSPTVSNASAITPFNFIGVEKETGKTFIGDNDVTKTPNGYGIAIAGSVIDYSVAEGVGEMYHNVEDVTTSKNPPISGNGWATYLMGSQTPKVQSGRLVIPASKGILPTLTADPDDVTGMWLKGMTVASTKVGATAEVFPERADDLVQDWTSLDGTYSYTLTSSFKNDAEVSARSKVVSIADIQALSTLTQLETLTEIKGRPFLTSDLTEAKLQELQNELAPDDHRVLTINYETGYGTNKLPKTVNLVVVGSNFTISEDGYYTVHTNQKVTMRQGILADILNKNQLADFYTNQTYVGGFGLSADEPATKLPVEPVSGPEHLTTLKNSSTFPVTDTQPYGLTYTQEGVEKVLSRDVEINVTGNTSTVTVEFRNENDDLMPGHTLTLTENAGEKLLIGTAINLTENQYGISEKLTSLEAAGYEIVERPASEENLNLTAEEMTVVYKLTGLVYLSSAPVTIDFGSVNYDATIKRVDNGTIDGDLVVNDTRVTKSKWVMGAKVKTPMTNATDTSVKLVDALQYGYANTTLILNDGLQRIYQEEDSSQADMKVTNISDTWGTTKQSDGIKLVVDPSKSKVLKGTYSGVIEWQFMEATP